VSWITVRRQKFIRGRGGNHLGGVKEVKIPIIVQRAAEKGDEKGLVKKSFFGRLHYLCQIWV